MRARDEQLLLRLWADMWRDEFSPVVARGAREPDEQTRQDVAAGFRSRVRARLLAGEFEGEDHAMLRRECAGRTPEVLVDVRWISPSESVRRRDDPARLPFIDAQLRCRALQHRSWHVRQPWQTSPTGPQMRGRRADRAIVDDPVRDLPRDGMRAGYDVVSADRRWRRQEIEERLAHLVEAQAREVYEARPPTPGLTEVIERFQRELASASAIPADILFRNELLGVWADRRSDDRADAATYAYRTAASMRQPDAAERRVMERERMRAQLALARADEISGSALDKFAELAGIHRTTDNAPAAKCTACGGPLGATWRKTCEKCASQEIAVNVFIAVVQVIHAACGLGFACGISSVAHLGATMSVVDPATSTTAIVAPDGYFSYAAITYGGVSARRVGRCTVHGVQHASHELYCTRCMLAACERRQALALLERILAAVGAAWFSSLPGATQRTTLLDVVDRVEPYTGEFADERPARASLLELGAPDPYVAPPGETAAELASEVDVRGGVRHLLLEME